MKQHGGEEEEATGEKSAPFGDHPNQESIQTVDLLVLGCTCLDLRRELRARDRCERVQRATTGKHSCCGKNSMPQ